MANIDFYITDDEKMELFDYITNNDGVFVPNLHYINPEIVPIQSKADFIRCIYEQTGWCFVVSSRFQTEPLTFSQLECGEYYIMQRQGGPCINVRCYLGYSNNAQIKYKCTQITHYPRYIHHDDFVNYDEFPASEDLKAYYKMMIKFLKSKCRQITAKNGKKYWVSKTLKEEDVL